MFRFPDSFRKIRNSSTSSGPSGHLPRKGKAQALPRQCDLIIVYARGGFLCFLTVFGKLISLTPDHLDIPGIRGIDLDFFPQMADMDGYGAF